MRASEALEAVNNMYLLGAVEFYSRVPGNPWQQAHDEFEGQIVLFKGDWSERERAVSSAAKQFVAKIESLLTQYRAIFDAQNYKPDPVQLSMELGLYSNSRDQEDARMSQHFQACGKCGDKYNLRIIKPKPYDAPGLYCFTCVPLVTGANSSGGSTYPSSSTR